MNAPSYGSQQLRLFRRAVRDGASIEVAAETAGISTIEARLTAEADRKNPPPSEAFELLFDPDAPAAASPPAKEPEMARPRKKDDHEHGEGGGIDGEYSRPDAAKAFDIYDKQIAPKLAKMDTIKGDLSQPYQDIKDHAHFPRKVLNFITSLEGQEDAKRDHMLLALAEGLKHRQLFLPRDLVTMADGEDGDDVVPSGARPRPKLVTVPDHPSDDSDLAGALDAEVGGDSDTFEASDTELAKQEGRGRKRAGPVAGTGAAAIKAMNESAEEMPPPAGNA